MRSRFRILPRHCPSLQAGQTYLRSLASDHEVRARQPAVFFLRLHLLTMHPMFDSSVAALGESQFDSIFGKMQGVGAGRWQMISTH